jgi:hypothetical protein
MAFVCQTVPIDLRESPVHRKKRIASTGFRNGDANDYSVFVPGNRLFREIQPMQHTRIFWRFDVQGDRRFFSSRWCRHLETHMQALQASIN